MLKRKFIMASLVLTILSLAIIMWNIEALLDMQTRQATITEMEQKYADLSYTITRAMSSMSEGYYFSLADLRDFINQSLTNSSSLNAEILNNITARLASIDYKLEAINIELVMMFEKLNLTIPFPPP